MTLPSVYFPPSLLVTLYLYLPIGFDVVGAEKNVAV